MVWIADFSASLFTHSILLTHGVADCSSAEPHEIGYAGKRQPYSPTCRLYHRQIVKCRARTSNTIRLPPTRPGRNRESVSARAEYLRVHNFAAIGSAQPVANTGRMTTSAPASLRPSDPAHQWGIADRGAWINRPCQLFSPAGKPAFLASQKSRPGRSSSALRPLLG